MRAFESWRLAFFLVALPAPLFLILLVFTRLGRTRTDATVAVETPVAPPVRRDFWPYAWRHRRAVARLFGALGLYMLAFGSYIWLPVACSRLFGTTPAENGAGMGIATAVGMVGGVAAGTLIVRRLITRLGSLAAIRFCWITMLASVPILIAFPFVTAAWQAFTLLGMLMLSGTAIGCMVPTMLQDMAPADLRARLFAVWGMVSGLASGSAPTLVGWTSTALGTEQGLLLIAMTIVAVLGWVAAIILFRMAERPFVALLDHAADANLDTLQ